MNEQELRQAMSAIEAYKAQLEAVNEQSQLLQMSLEDHSRAKDTLEAVAKGGLPSERAQECLARIDGA